MKKELIKWHWSSFNCFEPFICDIERICLGCEQVIKVGEVCRVRNWFVKNELVEEANRTFATPRPRQ